MDYLGKIFHVNFLGYAHLFIPIRIYQIKYHCISVDQARHGTSIADKYLGTDTVEASEKCYRTTFSFDNIFTKADASTSDKQYDMLTRELNIQCRDCIVSLIYLLCTRVDFYFAVHKFATF